MDNYEEECTKKIVDLNPRQDGGDGARFIITFKDPKRFEDHGLYLESSIDCYGIHGAKLNVNFDFADDMIALGEALIEVGKEAKAKMG